jgi:protoporphyrinogen oxidase
LKQFIDENVAPMLKMVFCGAARDMSAQYMLHRYLDCVEEPQFEKHVDDKPFKHSVEGKFVALRDGFNSLTANLLNKMKEELDEDGKPRFECKSETMVTSLSFVDQTIMVESQAKKEAFDHVISAIDLKQLANILRDTFAKDIEAIKYGSLVTCNLVFTEACLDPQLLYLLIPDGFHPADSAVRMEQITFGSHLFPFDESSTLVTATMAVPTYYVLNESHIQDFCLELLQSQQLQCGKL